MRGASDSGGRLARRGRLALVAGTLVLAAPFSASVGAGSLEDCVADKVADGVDRAVARVQCAREATTGGGDEPASESSDDGTSVGLLIGVGVAGLVLGALAMALLRGRASSTSAGTSVPAPSTPPSPSPPGAPLSPPTAAAPDRSRGLVSSLVDLSDRVPSQALRAEILAALAAAGVESVEIATGAHFDPATMRGVGSAPAPDATWNGRVAATERCGFRDGATVIRPPEVVVYTSGG